MGSLRPPRLRAAARSRAACAIVPLRPIVKPHGPVAAPAYPTPQTHGWTRVRSFGGIVSGLHGPTPCASLLRAQETPWPRNDPASASRESVRGHWGPILGRRPLRVSARPGMPRLGPTGGRCSSWPPSSWGCMRNGRWGLGPVPWSWSYRQPSSSAPSIGRCPTAALARLALGPQPVSVVTMADGQLLGLGLRGALGFGRRALSRAPGHADMGGSKPG